MGCNGSFQAHLFEFRVVGYQECSRIFWLGVVSRKPESETVRRCSLADPSGLEAGEPPRKPSRMRAIEKPGHLTRTSVLNAVKCARWYGVVACWLILAQGLTSQAATLSTDRLDYPPFSDVYIDGAGWAPGETVSVHLDEVEPNGTRTPVWDADPAPIADTTGSFTVEWFIWSDEFLGATLEVTAVGQSSGMTATTTFTDGSVTCEEAPNGTAPVGDPVGGFGIDGDLTADQPAPGIGDWLTGSSQASRTLS